MSTIGKHAYFTIDELASSNTATQLDINNTPTYPIIIQLDSLILNILDPLRDELDKPIIVTSGYRSPELNRVVGGVSDSQHLTGNAVDIISKYATPRELWNMIQQLSLNYDQCILEGTDKNPNGRWVHVSHVKENRKKAFTM